MSTSLYHYFKPDESEPITTTDTPGNFTDALPLGTQVLAPNGSVGEISVGIYETSITHHYKVWRSVIHERNVSKALKLFALLEGITILPSNPPKQNYGTNPCNEIPLPQSH